jgi:N-carbamoyl-L-amino-acid hydrolase
MVEARMDGIGEAVDGGWVWARLEELATFGALPNGGVRRLSLSGEEREATRRIAEWTDALGCRLLTDAFGNLFIRRDGTADLAPVVTGSHVDTQPAGGRYDGAYGVVAGLALLEALQRTGTRHRRPIEVVAWTNEEGSRFSPGTMGSAVFAGAANLARFLETTDSAGVPMGEELARSLALLDSLGAERRPFGFPIHALIEAHIEQGPILEAEGVPLGVVAAMQGPAWYRFMVEGEAAHAGTTPRSARRDAFLGASELAAALRAETLDPEDAVRFTIGRFEVSPGSPNTVPDYVLFTVDLRHFKASVLDRIDRAFAALAGKEWARCRVTMTRDMRLDPVTFSTRLVERLETAAARLGLPTRRMLSGAFHDAAYLARHCPAAMLFIPCAGGVSHHPAERITPEDATAGARVLAEAVLSLADEAAE